MGFLNKLLGGKKEPEVQASAPDAATETVCIHGTLVPRWDRVEDMGREDRVTSFTCESCSASLTPEEARQVMEAARDHLQV